VGYLPLLTKNNKIGTPASVQREVQNLGDSSPTKAETKIPKGIQDIE
jgi:hypothetical protein